MKRGVVLEVNAQFVTLLTPEGEFLKSRKVKEHYNIGEEIDFFEVKEYQTTKKPFFGLEKLRVGIATSIAAVLLFFTVFTFYDSKEVYAYMSIDINPSLEAGVDKKLRVISLEAYNDEGEQVLSSIEEWMNQPIDSVTKAIIQESRKSGYYEEGAEVLLATVIVEDEDEDESLKKHLNNNVQSVVQTYKEENIPVVVLNSTIHDRDVALQKGVSTGKYLKESMIANEKETNKELDKTKANEEKNDENKQATEKNNNGKSGKIEDNVKDFIDKKPETPASQNKDKDKINVEVKDKIKIELNKGKNQEDEKGPPEAVQELLKEKRDEKKKDKGKSNKNGNDDDNDDDK